MDAHAPGEEAKGVVIALGLPPRRDGGAGALHVVVPVAGHQVVVLQERRGGQHDVRVVHGVGGHLLVHHGEQILAQQPLLHPRLLRRDGRGIRVVHVQRPHRRRRQFGQRLAQPHHVHGARGRVVGPRGRQRPRVEPGAAPAEGEQAAPGRLPGTGQGGQAGDGARGHAAVGVAREPQAEPDEAGPGAAVGLRQRHHVRRGDAGDGLHPGRVVVRAGRGKLVEAVGVAGDEVRVVPAGGQEVAHHAQRQRRIGAGPHLHEPVGLLGRRRPVHVDHHQPCPVAARLAQERHQVHVARHRILPPHQHQLGCRQGLDVRAHAVAHGHPHALHRRAGADRALQAAGAQGMKEAVPDMEPDLTAGAAVGVGEDRLRPVGRDDRAPARGDLVQRLVPADGREAPFALGPDAAQGREHALGMVHALGVAADLPAEQPRGDRVRGISREVADAAVLDPHLHAAGVRAVVRADRRAVFGQGQAAGVWHHGGTRWGAGGRGGGWPRRDDRVSIAACLPRHNRPAARGIAPPPLVWAVRFWHHSRLQ